MNGLRKAFCLTVLALLLMPPALVAQQSTTQIPATAAGARLSALMNAFGSNDESVWKEFIEQNWVPSDKEGAMERRMMFFQRVNADMGGMDMYRIEDPKEFEDFQVGHKIE